MAPSKVYRFVEEEKEEEVTTSFIGANKSWRTGIPARGLLSILGGILVNISFGVDFSLSNLNSYMTSYMRSTGSNATGEFVPTNPGLNYSDFVFVMVAHGVSKGLCMPLFGMVARKIGVRASIFIGSILLGGGFLLMSVAVNYSFPLVVLCMCFHGFGFGFVYATAIGNAQKWSPEKIKGFVGSICISGYGFGSIIWIPVQTTFVNPNNEKAVVDPDCPYINTDHQDNCDYYFTDPHLLSNVPKLFILLGSCFLGFGVLATLLMTDPDEKETNSGTLSCTACTRSAVGGSVGGVNCTGIADDTVWTTENDQEKGELEEAFSLTPLQALQTKALYMIWFGFYIIYFISGIVVIFGKVFALPFISDDHYFAIIGITSHIFNGTIRMFWGAFYDRFGFRGSYILLSSLITVSVACLPALTFLPAESLLVKVCYGVLMAVLFSTYPGIFSIVAVAASHTFGQKYYQANFGILFTVCIASSASTLFLTKVPVVKAFLGFNGMFFVAAILGILGSVVVAFLPKKLDSNVYRERFSKKFNS